MAMGSWTATAVSTLAVPANEFREHLLIQKTNLTIVAIGIGAAAEAGKGVQLGNVGDSILLHGANARLAVYILGNGGTGTWQDGDILYIPGTFVTA